MKKDFKILTDNELFIELGGERATALVAFEELYSRHSRRIFTYILRILGDEFQAEDVYQETFARLYSSAREKRTVHNVTSYLFRIARNLCLNEKRKKDNQNVTFEEFRFAVRDENYESTELLRLVNMALEMLQEEYREAFVLREHVGLSYNEIAEVVGTTMPVIRTRIYRAKQKIRAILAPYVEDLQK